MDLRIPVTVLVLLVLAAAILAALSGLEEPPEDAGAGNYTSRNTAHEDLTPCEGGTLYFAGPVPVVVLDGDFQEMGRQYGCLMRPQILDYYNNTVAAGFPQGAGYTEEETVALALNNYQRYPSRIRSLIEGMAETTGLTVDELVLTDQYTAFSALADPKEYTYIAAWGDYTGGGPLVSGTDATLYSGEPAGTAAVVVYNPNDGSRPVASVCHAGEVSAMNALTGGGLVLSLDPAPVSGEFVLSARRVPQFIKFILYYMGTGSTSSFEAHVLGYRTPAPFILNAADDKAAYSYECSTTRCIRWDGSPGGLLVSTGHYQGPLSEMTHGAAGSARWNDSVTRAAELAALAGEQRGTVDAAVMRQVLDAARPDNTIEAGTVVRYVAVPEQEMIWVKVPGRSGWVEVDLNQLFW